MSFKQIPVNARAFPRSDARCPRPSNVSNKRGFPRQGRPRITKLVHKYHRLRFATINVGTLTGRVSELTEVLRRRRIEIACVQETHWKGEKAYPLGDGYKLYYYGTSNKRNGVAVALAGHLANRVIEVKRVSDRIMAIRVDTDCGILQVVSVYAPQTNCPEDEKDEFLEKLGDLVRSAPPEDKIIVGGDFNAHIGRDRIGHRRTMGRHGFGSRNEDGEKLLEFAGSLDLVVLNTFFRKRESQTVTYESGRHRSQIDFVLVHQSSLKYVMDCKVLPNEIIAPQHRPVVADFRFTKKATTKIRTTGDARIKWWKTREQSSEQACKDIVKAIPEINPTVSAAVNWQQCADAVRKVASERFGVTKPGTSRIKKETWWWTNEVEAAIKSKKEAFKQWRQTRTQQDKDTYNLRKKEAKIQVAKAKQEHFEDLYRRLETRQGESEIYRIAKARHAKTRDIGNVRIVKAADGRVLYEDKDIMDRWREHYKEISTTEFPHPQIPRGTPNFRPVPVITEMEVRVAVNKMKIGKCTGPDDIPAEVWKLAGDKGVRFLTKLYNKIVEDNEIPAEWKKSTTVPIWKGKGDTLTCNNYRPIRLLSHTLKIFERVLDARIRECVEITPNQTGFRPGCGTTDAIFALRILAEKHREKKLPLHIAFVDLEKAFDRVPHDLIWYSLRDAGVPEEYIKWVKMLYTDSRSQVRSVAGTTRPFEVTVGVHQGSAISPLLFILCLDRITRDIQGEHPWTLLYADDIVLARSTRDELKKDLKRLKERLERHGLRMNTSKTEYLELEPRTSGDIELDGTKLPRANDFKYLGDRISADGESLSAVKGRIDAAWLKWRQCSGVLCDKKMPTKLKSRIYRTVVRPVALYGSQTWPVTKKIEQKMSVAEMKMARWSLGVTRLDRIPNTDIRKKLGIAPIADKMREYRLRWYGHVLRQDPNQVARTAWNLELDGTRPRGRPKTRYIDTVKKDMTDAGLRERDARDRKRWRDRTHVADPST